MNKGFLQLSQSEETLFKYTELFYVSVGRITELIFNYIFLKNSH